MSSARESKAEAIFVEALEVPESRRRDHLERACAGDSELLARVETLLQNYFDGAALLGSEGIPKRVREVLGEAANGLPLGPGSTKQQTLSHYRLFEKIGEGGMGVVWKAQDNILNRTVAIKVLPADLSVDEKRRRMFLDEARLAASVSHAHIVQVYELGRDGDVDFIVMEYVEGQPLSRLLHGRPLPPDKVADWGLQIAEGLARAHRKGLIHRDLKPANILVTPEGELKIVDFGLATLFSPPEGTGTSTHTLPKGTLQTGKEIVGTIPYMSPEQVRGDKLDARSDIFSFGAVLYEMVTGLRPFTGRTHADVASQILKGQPTPVHELVPDVPLDLHRLVEKTLAVRPTDRYQHVDDIAVDLKRLARDLASGSSPSYLDLRRASTRRLWSRGARRWIALGLVFAAIAGLATWRLSGKRAGKRPAPTLQQLTFNPPEVAITDAEISPDGKYIAYGDTDLYLLRIDSGETHRLPLPENSTFAEGLAWFPDDTALLVPVWQQDGETRRHPLWRLSLLGRDLRKIAEEAHFPVVSPDGRRVAFRTRDLEVGNRAALFVMGAHGEDPRKVLGVERFAPFAWSPDGTRLAYARRENDTTIIESCDLQGGAVQVHFADPHFFPRGEILWFPDGRIIYQRRELPPNENYVNLWSIRADDHGVANGPGTRLTNLSGVRVFMPSVSSTGQVAAVISRPLYDVHVGDLDDAGSPFGNSLRRLTWDDRNDHPSDWTPDGTAVLLMSNRTGNWDIYKQDLHERVAEPLVSGPADETNPVLSPDGIFLLYKVRTTGASPETHLMRVPVTGGPAHVVMDLGANDFFRCAKRPGGPCVVSEPLAEELVFWELDPMAGRGREIARVRGAELRGWSSSGSSDWARTGWDLSPEGSRLAVVLTNPPQSTSLYVGGIRIIALAGEGTIELFPIDAALYTLAWAADGQSLFATGSRAEPGDYVVLRIDQSGHAQTFLSLPTTSYSYPRPSPDGRHLAFRWQGWDANVWLVEHF